MAAALDPVRLAELVDLAERPRVDGWSLRAALCRYAQPQPERAGALLSLIRRIEATFAQNLAELRSDGPDLLRQAEDLRSPEDIADVIVHICDLPDHLNFYEGMVVQIDLPFLGRG